MKELSGTAAATVSAPAPRCVALLADIERYPAWHPDVIRRAEVLERDGSGAPIRARATVHVAAGPLARDFDLLLDVTVRPDGVRLVRVPHGTRDEERFEVDWEIREGASASIKVMLVARLDVPRLLPLGGVGESVAQGFVEAARRVLEDPRSDASAGRS